MTLGTVDDYVALMWQLGDVATTVAFDAVDSIPGEYIGTPTLGVPGLQDIHTAVQFHGGTDEVVSSTTTFGPSSHPQGIALRCTMQLEVDPDPPEFPMFSMPVFLGDAFGFGFGIYISTDNPPQINCQYSGASGWISGAHDSWVMEYGVPYTLIGRYNPITEELELWVDGVRVAHNVIGEVPAIPAGSRLHVGREPGALTVDLTMENVLYYPDGLTDTDDIPDPPIALATSTQFSSKSPIVGLQFATQQSPALQRIPDDQFRDPLLLDYNWDNDAGWHLVGDAVLTYDPDKHFVKINRNNVGVAVTLTGGGGVVNVPIHPVLRWGETEIIVGDNTVGGLESGTRPISAAGTIWGAVRLIAITDISNPIHLEIVTADGFTILVSKSFTAKAGQTIEDYVGYIIGSQVDGGSVRVRLVQYSGPSTSEWNVDALSLFDDAITWEFSADGGTTWLMAHGIRNNPYGVLKFQPPIEEEDNTQLVYRVKAYATGMSVNSLQIRPWYQNRLITRRESPQRWGPNISSFDQQPSIIDDPEFNVWPKPIPRSWFREARLFPYLSAGSNRAFEGVPNIGRTAHDFIETTDEATGIVIPIPQLFSGDASDDISGGTDEASGEVIPYVPPPPEPGWRTDFTGAADWSPFVWASGVGWAEPTIVGDQGVVTTTGTPDGFEQAQSPSGGDNAILSWWGKAPDGNVRLNGTVAFDFIECTITGPENSVLMFARWNTVGVTIGLPTMYCVEISNYHNQWYLYKVIAGVWTLLANSGVDPLNAAHVRQWFHVDGADLTYASTAAGDPEPDWGVLSPTATDSDITDGGMLGIAFAFLADAHHTTIDNLWMVDLDDPYP